MIWILAVLAALGWTWMQQSEIETLIPYASVAAVPTVMTILMWPILHKEWAQLMVIFGWLALAIAACVGVAFFPMAILFLCAPAAAFLFHSAKVIEAMILSAILAAMLYYAQQYGALPEAIPTPAEAEWAKNTALMACIFMMVAVLIISGLQDEAMRKQIAIANLAQTPDNEVSNGANNEANAGMGQLATPRLPLRSQFLRATSVPPEAVLLEKMPGAVLHIDRSGLPLYMSAKAKTLLGVAAQDDVNMDNEKTSLADMLSFDMLARTEVEALLAQTRATAEPQTAGVDMTKPDGSFVHYNIIATPMKGADVALYMTDITEQKGELDMLRQSAELARDASSDKTLFFAGVSHELRTPLNAIIGFSDMMRTRLFGPLPGKYAEYADLIHDSGQHMLDLIGDVLDLSKAEAGKYDLQYGLFDMADVVRSSLKMVQPIADAAEVRVETNISEHEDYILTADRRALRQILLNLLSNAIKFSPKGERVLVSAMVVEDMMNIVVSDNGSGMDSEELADVGKPFTQARSAQLSDARGSGLGLSLVKSLVELHEGRMDFASQSDVGTVVNIYIPLARPSVSPSVTQPVTPSDMG